VRRKKTESGTPLVSPASVAARRRRAANGEGVTAHGVLGGASASSLAGVFRGGPRQASSTDDRGSPSIPDGGITSTALPEPEGVAAPAFAESKDIAPLHQRSLAGNTAGRASTEESKHTVVAPVGVSPPVRLSHSKMYELETC